MCVSQSISPGFAPRHSRFYPLVSSSCRHTPWTFSPGEHDADEDQAHGLAKIQRLVWRAACPPKPLRQSMITLHRYDVIYTKRGVGECHLRVVIVFRRRRRQNSMRDGCRTNTRESVSPDGRSQKSFPQLPASGHQARGSPASQNKSVDADVGNWAGDRGQGHFRAGAGNCA